MIHLFGSNFCSKINRDFCLLKNRWKFIKCYGKSPLFHKNRRTSLTRMDILSLETATLCEKPLTVLWIFTQREMEIFSFWFCNR